MKSALLGGVLACLSGFFSPALAITTTYTYTGADYTYSAFGVGPVFPLTLDQFKSLIPGTYGPHLTGSITFEGDTSAFTGTLSPLTCCNNPPFFLANLDAISFTSGSINMAIPDRIFTQFDFPPSSVSFVDGVITSWQINLFTIGNACNSIVCGMGGNLRSSNSGDFVRFRTGFIGWNSTASTDTPGVWTIEPVPAPVVGAGLPGLMLASLGWLGWRRSHRKTT